MPRGPPDRRDRPTEFAASSCSPTSATAAATARHPPVRRGRGPDDGRAFAHVLLRPQKVGLQPACATACPTESILFGEIGELREKAHARVEQLQSRGIDDAMVYDPQHTSVGGTHAIFVLRGRPENYNLPSSPEVPTVHLRDGWTGAAVAAGLMLVGSLAAFLASRTSR